MPFCPFLPGPRQPTANCFCSQKQVVLLMYIKLFPVLNSKAMFSLTQDFAVYSLIDLFQPDVKGFIYFQ